MKDSKRVVLVTGASSGIGQACATYLHQRDYQVYGTSRHAVHAGSIYSESFHMIQMDVNVDRSVQRGIEHVWEREGRLDVVVNNAGFGIAGSIEDTTTEEAKAQFETNFFGALRVCRAVLPIMRAQRAGHIVNISSMAGLAGVPFQGLYSASKFALEGLSEALRLELRPFGIRVVLIEPGDFETSFTARRRRTAQSGENAVYKDRFNTTLGIMEADESRGANPTQVAHLVERIIENPSPRMRYTVGPLIQRIEVTLKQIVPSWLYERVISRYYRLG
jgi:NAD(P)-dependent dehydrogenase (short-subunit alcohol dehydrogenase family)